MTYIALYFKQNTFRVDPRLGALTPVGGGHQINI